MILRIPLAIGTIAVAVSAVAVLAQGRTDDITVVIQPSTLVRGHTSIVDVRVSIPDGHFVPAETRGAVKGAWLQPVETWLSRALPTYPIPDFVRLPGSSTPVLAYSGTITIRVPIEVPPGVTGRRRFGFRFDYQLCDAASCVAVRTRTTTTEVTVDEPSATDASLAFRVDASHVAIVTDRQARVNDQGVDFVTPAARYALRIAPLPESHAGRAQLDERFGPGSHWTVMSNGRQFDAVAEAPAAFRPGCEPTPLVLIARITGASFRTERAKYFLARRVDGSRSADSPFRSSLDIDVRLTGTERRELEALLNHQLRMTLPTITAPDHVLVRKLSAAEAQPAETTFDGAIREGKARLVYHVEAFNLAPDGDARLYVRAHWAVGGNAERGLTLWVRYAAGRFQVERSDAAVSRLAPYLAAKDVGSDIAARPEFAGTLLNVIPSSDGWAFVVMGHRGYESFSVSVWKYSPVGPLDTGIAYGYGC
jgi:hypothetical protein